MKCYQCHHEMGKGAISTAGKSDTMWYSRESFFKGIFGHNLIAWRCPKCGRVELVTEIKSDDDKEKS